MAQPLKDLINERSVGLLADGVAAAWSPFPRDRFVTDSLSGLPGLELKDRVRHVAGCLHAGLALPFPQAAAVLADAARAVPLDLWSGWPATDYLALHGLDHLDAAMSAIAVLTPHSTGEFAVRPYLTAHREAALRIMYGWAESPDEHLRRLASEGTRPRLPWGAQVRWLMEPGPTLPLLGLLRDDPSEYVRRSVANHVNDFAKTHPERTLELLGGWRDAGGSHVERVLRHALRGLLRSGHPGALDLVGAVPGNGVIDSLSLAGDTVAVGDSLPFTVVLRADGPGPLILKYTVTRDGSRRTFHLAERLATTRGETFTVRKRHSFRPVTTRQEAPGPRTLDIMVNGRLRATARFTLTPASGA
ncbi:DNA alkylation repair protein [Nonomuraea sp. NPDC050310]|uniref:DNA alkylation repair protein n=1 Tax=Nonomuraea sp. NPDC050310 TaxID=3154935 RepID=UPI0033DC3BCD